MITRAPVPSYDPEPVPAPPPIVGALPDPAFAPPVVRPKRAPAAPKRDPWLERWMRLAQAIKRRAPRSLALCYLFLGGLFCGAIVGSVVRTALPGKAYSYSLPLTANNATARAEAAGPPEPLDVEIAKAKAELDAELRDAQK